MESLAAVVAATVAIALALTRIMAAARPAIESFIPHRWGWVPTAILASCSTIILTVPGAQCWMDYAVIMIGVVAVFAVSAQAGLRPS